MPSILRTAGRLAWSLAIITFIILILYATSLGAKTTTWTDADAGDHNWSTAGNWNNGAPASMDVVLFSAIGGTSVHDIPGLFLDQMNMSGYTGTLDLQNDITSLGDVVLDGSVVMGAFSALSIAADLTVLGYLDAVSAPISVGGSITVTDSLDADGATIDAGGDFTGGTGAGLNMGACYLAVQGDIDLSQATVTWNAGGTLRLYGGFSQNLSLGANSSTLNHLTIDHSSVLNVIALTSATPVTIGGNLTINGGTLDVAAADLTLNGATTTIQVNGAFESSGTGGVITLNTDLSVNGSFTYQRPGGELDFDPAFVVGVQNGATFEASGAGGNPVVLHDDGIAGGSQWAISYANPADITVNYAEVQDSDAQGPGAIIATNSTDLGNNTNWNFGGPKVTTWTDAAMGNSNWSDDYNWDRGAPGNGDIVLFSAISGTSTHDIAGLDLEEIDMNGYTGTLTLSQSLAVTTDAHFYGNVDASGSTIIAGGNINIFGAFDGTFAYITLAGDLTVAGSFVGHNAIIEVHGNMAGSGGSVVTMGGGLLDFLGLSLSFDGTFGWTTGTLRLRGSGLQQLQLGALAGPLAHVLVNRTSSSDETRISTTGTDIEIAGELQIDRGTLALFQGGLSIAGPVTVAPSATLMNMVTPGVDMTFGSEVLIGGTCTVTADSVTMGFSSTDTVFVIPTGTFEVIGGSGTRRNTLEQDGSPNGPQWLLQIQAGATTTFENVNVQESDASSGQTAVATGEAIDHGNNDNWDFNPTGVGEVPPPLSLSLRAVPNPFNPLTRIDYVVPRAGSVSLVVYNVRGGTVRTLVAGRKDAGPNSVTWDGRNDTGHRVGSGTYFCRLLTDDGATVRKLVLLK